MEDTRALRGALKDLKLVAFVGDGAILPRAAGIFILFIYLFIYLYYLFHLFYLPTSYLLTYLFDFHFFVCLFVCLFYSAPAARCKHFCALRPNPVFGSRVVTYSDLVLHTL